MPLDPEKAYPKFTIDLQEITVEDLKKVNLFEDLPENHLSIQSLCASLKNQLADIKALRRTILPAPVLEGYLLGVTRVIEKITYDLEILEKKKA